MVVPELAVDKLGKGKRYLHIRASRCTHLRVSHNDNTHRMVPPLLKTVFSRLLHTLVSAVHTQDVHPSRNVPGPGPNAHAFVRRDIHDPDERAMFIIFSCLIPILVLLSGLFAGLTLGYMSLDETQLNVLSVSGTP